MTHKTRVVAARLFLGGLLLGVPLIAGCGGGGGGNQNDQFAMGASITKQAHVVVDTGIPYGSTQPRTVYFLRDADGHFYMPTNLDAAFQKDGLRVQFSATVNANLEGYTDGGSFIDITLTSIHVL